MLFPQSTLLAACRAARILFEPTAGRGCFPRRRSSRGTIHCSRFKVA
jgi:hypothetical protein